MRKPERVKVLANEPAESGPYTLACTDLDTGEDCILRYWASHNGEENPACGAEEGRCYAVGLRLSRRKDFDDEWMVRECEQIPDEVPPRIPTKNEHILALACLREAGDSLRCQFSEGSPFGEKDKLVYTEALFEGMMKMLAAKCGTEKR